MERPMHDDASRTRYHKGGHMIDPMDSQPYYLDPSWTPPPKAPMKPETVDYPVYEHYC